MLQGMQCRSQCRYRIRFRDVSAMLQVRRKCCAAIRSCGSVARHSGHAARLQRLHVDSKLLRHASGQAAVLRGKCKVGTRAQLSHDATVQVRRHVNVSCEAVLQCCTASR
jgi:hypothetical protein